jgi:hypothetical protein
MASFTLLLSPPWAASDSGKPSAEAKRDIDETTGPDKPRNYRNAVVLAVPSRDGIEAARNRIRDYLEWEEIRIQLKEQLKGQELDPIREATLSANISGGRSKIAEAIQQAYCIVVTVSEKNEIQSFKIAVEGPSLFACIKMAIACQLGATWLPSSVRTNNRDSFPTASPQPAVITARR